MSFQRKGGPLPKKPPFRKKPVWDDSVHDLTVYKATPDEILMRKEAHKSKNHMSVKLEQMRKEKQRTKLTGAEAQQLAIMKEVLYDQQQLQNIVAKSDRMMAVVKDLFGDDPKRFTGFPNVTAAPKASSVSNSLVAPVADIYTRTEKLSDSVMGTSALNDVDVTDSEEDEEVDRPEPISYESKLNLLKFQQFLQEEEKKLEHQDPQTLVAQQSQKDSQDKAEPTSNSSNGNQKLPHNFLQILNKALSEQDQEMRTKLVSQDPQLFNSLMMAALTVQNGSNNGLKTPPRSQQGDPRLVQETTPLSAINDTKKVKKTRRQIKSPPATEVNGNSSMTDMRKALQDLEKELNAYEHQMGRGSSVEKENADSFSGYTVALVGSVSRLTKYLKEMELRLKTEMTLREQLTEDVFQLRTIIDALATDIIMTQEEYAKLYTENQRYKEASAKEILDLKNEMQEMRRLLTGQTSTPLPSENGGKCVIEADNVPSKNVSNNSTHSFSPVHSHQDTNLPSSKDHLPAESHMKQDGTASAMAILLSPPVRKSRVTKDVKNSKNISEPSQFTQVPPVIETISVPRPIPLVQSNLPVNLPSTTSAVPSANATNTQDKIPSAGSLQDLVKLGDQTQEQIHHLQEMAVEEALKNPALQDLMQTQIAELNRQQEEARKRLQDLLANQKLQQKHLQEQLGSNILDDGFSPSPLNHQQQMAQSQVSPPISPISQDSEKPMKKGSDAISQIPMGQGISLSLPMVDLDVSTGSLT